MTNANGSKVFRFCAKKLDCPCSPARPNAQQVSPAPARSAGSPHGENHSPTGYDGEHGDYLSLGPQAAQPKRARIVDGRQRTHAVHAINTLALQKQQI
jgi:hypothetical protein